MKILIVCNNVYVEGNGLRTAVLSLLGTLKQKGVDARLLSCENDDPSGPQPDFPLKHFKVPVFEPLIEKAVAGIEVKQFKYGVRSVELDI